MREDTVEEMFGAKLKNAGDELRFGVRVKSGEEGVAPSHPDVVEVETELSPSKCQRRAVFHTG